MLASLVRNKNTSLVLDGLPHTRMSDMVVIAQAAEGISAAFQATVIADRGPAVSTFSHGCLAARRSYVAVTRYVFNLAGRSQDDLLRTLRVF